MAESCAGLAVGVQEHIAQGGGMGFQERGHADGLLALVQEHEMQVGPTLLRLLQHGHLAAARRAPRGPQVDDNRPALEAFQRVGAARERLQAQGGKPGIRRGE